jgi:hypothetical protein
VKYTAHALTAASRPVVLTIGRASDRRGLRALSRWWVRRFRTWTARPISTAQMLALQAANADGVVPYVIELALVLRSVFPRRWWHRLTGDPVARILRLGQQSPELQGRVLRRLVTVPGADRDESKDTTDLYAELRAAQRRAVYGEQGARGPSLSLASAAMTVRAAYGDAWYWNPARWQTADGYAPFAVCLLEYAGLQALDARRRLEVADGFAIAHAKDPKRVRSQLEKVAYPSDLVS